MLMFKMTDNSKRALLRAALATVVSVGFHLVVFPFDGWPKLAVGVLITVALAVMVAALVDRAFLVYAGTPERQALRTGLVQRPAEVWQNGVLLGSMEIADYAALRRGVYRDPRLAFEQLVAVGRFVVRALDKVVVMVPILGFWFAIGTAVFAPEIYVDLAREVQSAAPGEIATAARNLVLLGLVLVLASLAMVAALSDRFSIRNCYSEALADRLRLHFKSTTVGSISVHWHAPVQATSSVQP